MGVMSLSSCSLLLTASLLLVHRGDVSAQRSEHQISAWIEHKTSLLAFSYDSASWRDATAACAKYDASLVAVSDTNKADMLMVGMIGWDAFGAFDNEAQNHTSTWIASYSSDIVGKDLIVTFTVSGVKHTMYSESVTAECNDHLFMDYYSTPGQFGSSCDAENTAYRYVCEKRNPCIDQPCVNSTCGVNVTTGDMFCNCTENFTGEFCQLDTQQCISLNCTNDGVCAKQRDEYACACPPTHAGVACEHLNHCYGVVCENDGACEISLDNYTCVCTAHFTGLNCETKIERESERATSTASQPNYQAAFYAAVSAAAFLALVMVVCFVTKRRRQCCQNVGLGDSTRRSSTQLHNSDVTTRQQNSPAHHTDNISVISGVNTGHSSDVDIYAEIGSVPKREMAVKAETWKSDYEAPECCRYERPTCCHGQQPPPPGMG